MTTERTCRLRRDSMENAFDLFDRADDESLAGMSRIS
jgi:hypothetical protein